MIFTVKEFAFIRPYIAFLHLDRFYYLFLNNHKLSYSILCRLFNCYSLEFLLHDLSKTHLVHGHLNFLMSSSVAQKLKVGNAWFHKAAHVTHKMISLCAKFFAKWDYI